MTRPSKLTDELAIQLADRLRQLPIKLRVRGGGHRRADLPRVAGAGRRRRRDLYATFACRWPGRLAPITSPIV